MRRKNGLDGFSSISSVFVNGSTEVMNTPANEGFFVGTSLWSHVSIAMESMTMPANQESHF